MKKIVAIIAGATLSLSAYAGGSYKKDIVDTASNAGTFETLVAAVEAADLADTLKGDGPFTVFAPTDEAFSALPEGTVEDLLKPENKDQLVAILSAHVIPGKVMSTDLSGSETTAESIAGVELIIDSTDGVTVNGAMVTQADIATSNGVIHAIDSVILPADPTS